MAESPHRGVPDTPPLLTKLQVQIVAAVEEFNDAGEMSPSLRQLCAAIGWSTSSSGSMSGEVQELIRIGVFERVGRTLRVARRWQRRHER